MMKTILAIIGVIAIGTVIWFVASPSSTRSEALGRVGGVADSIRSEDDERTPDIVAKQQRKEKIRQNTKWTAENQALHPVEYCQAQLEEIDRYASRIEVAMHKLAVSQSVTKRTIADCESQISDIKKFLDEAKAAYRDAEAKGAWPMKFRGFVLDKAKAQEKIVDAAQRLQPLSERIDAQRNFLVMIERRQDKIRAEQKKLVLVRERVQNTINDLNTKSVMDGEKGITDALNGINDSIGVLGTDVDDPTLDDMLAPDKQKDREITFAEIMKD